MNHRQSMTSADMIDVHLCSTTLLISNSTLLEEGLAGHLLGLGETHNGKNGGGDVSEGAILDLGLERLLLARDNEGNGVWRCQK